MFSDVRGLNSADPPTRLPDDMATDVFNVLLEPQSLGRRRPSAETVSLSSGPSSVIEQLVRYQPAVASSAAELWAFSGTADVHRLASGTWASVTESDTVTSWQTSRPYGVTFNGKLFLAYDSDVNRLHVWDGTQVRRVGIESSGVPTAANSFVGGAYAAVLRYYKVQFRIISGLIADAIASSELSASVSFTPSGAADSVTVGKPTTPDSATHWVVYASTDDVTYYQLSSTIAVGTTTYSDSTATTAYSAGTVAPTAGLNVPPPAAKYLLATDNRLFMAGAWEASATSKQTSPRNSRVWFTQVLGARDNTGEDESIVQTTDLKYWVDVGENDGDGITGLGGAVDGAIYAFKSRSVWRLSPTGNASVPYRAECISASLGATWQDAIALGEDAAGNPAIYFQSLTGPKRIVNGYGIEDLGPDVRSYSATTYSSVDDTPMVVWDSVRRIAWWLTYDALTAYAFQPQFEERTREGVRGGWTRHSVSCGGDRNRSAVCYELSSVLVPYIGGKVNSGGTAFLASLSGGSYRDVSSGTYPLSSAVISKIYQPGGLLQRVGFGHAVLEFDYTGEATTPAVSVSSAIGGPLAVLGTVSDTATSSTYTTAVVQEKLESIQLSDVFGFQITVTWDTDTSGTERPRIHGVTIPVTLQEGA